MVTPTLCSREASSPGSSAAEVVVAAVAVEEAMVEEVTVVLVQVASRCFRQSTVIQLLKWLTSV